MKKHVIAIDGPSGSGKSSLAGALAARFGYFHIDTGALYRTVGLYIRGKGINPSDEGAVADALTGIDVSIKHIGGEQHVFLGGEDVSEAIRENEISFYASETSKYPAVRALLLGTQRRTALESDVILDGRDIGTVIFPDADVKIYLTASAETRAKRRFKELTEKGERVTYEQVLADMQTRDRRDSEREIAPLKKADDAIELDNGGMSFSETVEAAADIIERKLG